MRDWDQHLDKVLGANNSTRLATTGFSPYMLTRGTEKAIPLTYLYSEVATHSFATLGAYVDHVLARQKRDSRLGASQHPPGSDSLEAEI